MPTNQTPEALADEIKRLADCHAYAYETSGTDHAGYLQAHAELHEAIERLRDMAASGAKDAERYQAIRAANDNNDSEELCLCVVKNAHFDFVSTGAELDELADATIAATKSSHNPPP